MKKIIYASLAIVSFVRITAQQHYCAAQKAKYAHKNLATSLPPGYIPPESNYDLKFYQLNVNYEQQLLLYLKHYR